MKYSRFFSVAAVVCLGVEWAQPGRANEITFANTVLYTDFTVAGVGGMRDIGSGVITVSQIQGPVTRAYLYWHGPMSSSDPNANADVLVDGQPVHGSNIGFSGPSCWPNFTLSQGYRAEVTSLVSAKGNGAYRLSGFLKPGNINVNGASLIVFFSGNNPANKRDVVIFHGNEANFYNHYDADNWNVVLSGINYANRGTNAQAFIQLHVADGQVFSNYDDDALRLNGVTIAPPGAVFSGDSVPSANNGPRHDGSLWDIKTWEITSLLSPGSNRLNLSMGYVEGGDCLALAVVLIDLPAGSMGPIPGGNPPALVVRPRNTSAGVGGTALFAVEAKGAGALTYQWSFQGLNLSKQTNDTLVIENVQVADAGDYQVLVTDLFGSTLSRAAKLTVFVAPVITTQPARVAVSLGTNASFCVEATGSVPLRFQWRRNGVNIAGATNACYLLPKVQVEDGGNYSVVVSGPGGSILSQEARLSVLGLPINPLAHDHFADRLELPGANGIVSANNLGATQELAEPNHAGKPGGHSVWYVWKAPAKGIARLRTSGSSFDTMLAVYSGDNLAALGAVASDEDRGGYLASDVSFNAQPNLSYQIAIDGYAGAQGDFVLSWSLELTGEELPVITTQPESRTVTNGAPVSLRVSASGLGLSYQWIFNGSPLPGATGPLMALKAVSPSQVGSYTVRVISAQSRLVESLPAVVEIGSVANTQSQDKLEDVLFGIPGQNALRVVRAAATSEAFISVASGTIGSQILNNSSSTNSGRAETSLSCGLTGGARRWFSLRVESAGTLSIDTRGSEIQTILGVFTLGGRSEPTKVACDEEDAAGVVRFPAGPGIDYLIGVDGRSGQTGVIRLNWGLGVPLTIWRKASNLLFSWPASATGFNLQETSSLPANPPLWSAVPGQPVSAGGTNTLSVPLPSSRKFYRLQQP